MSVRYTTAAVLAGFVVLNGCGGFEVRSQRGQPVGVTVTSSATGTSPTPADASTVIVGKGDTVYGLSRRYRVSVRDIIVENRLRPPYRLTIGQRIVLPHGTVHIVRAGETLYRIARSHDVSVYALARANAIGPPYTIFVDQKLRIPGSTSAQAVASSSPSAKVPRALETASIPVPATRPTAPKTIPRPPVTSGSGFLWPARGEVISLFGPKEKGLHNDGINIAAPAGAPIGAAENGVVAYAGNELRGFGNLILIKHSNGFVTAYAHAREILVARGDKVRRGQTIARVGSTGNVTSPQLHFEVRRGKTPLDPKKHLPPGGA